MKTFLSIRFIVVILGLNLLLIGGCGSSAPTRFYLLNSLSGPETGQGSPEVQNSIAIGIGPVTLSEYLNRPQIVTRSSQNELRLAEFDQWAEPLKENVSRVLAENLSAFLSTDSIAVLPWKKSDPIDYQVAVDLIRFEGKIGEDVLLNARWTILGEDGKKVLLKKKSSFRTAVDKKEYEALVSAMNKALEDLSREIAETIKDL